MNTNIWGPSAWEFLHHIPFKSSNSNHQLAFFKILKHVLPCCHCRDSYSVFFSKSPLTLDILEKPNGLTYWLYDIHNMVNDKLSLQGIEKKFQINKSNVIDYYANNSKDKSNLGFIFMACVAYNANKHNWKHTVKFFKLLGEIHPDESMRQSWKEYMKSTTINEYNKRRIYKWFFESPIVQKYGCTKEELQQLIKYCS